MTKKSELVKVEVTMDRKITQALLDVVQRHKLGVGIAMAHLLQLAAAMGKAYSGAVGTQEEAKALFLKNAGVAWDHAVALEPSGPLS